MLKDVKAHLSAFAEGSVLIDVAQSRLSAGEHLLALYPYGDGSQGAGATVSTKTGATSLESRTTGELIIILELIETGSLQLEEETEPGIFRSRPMDQSVAVAGPMPGDTIDPAPRKRVSGLWKDGVEVPDNFNRLPIE